MKKICHITTVHHTYDTRIFYRQCTSLVRNGFEVHLIVVNQKEVEEKNGIHIHNLKVDMKNRLQRMLKAGNAALEKALEIDADLYHFHDPELLSMGIKLRRKGKVVIYDIHENVPLQMYSKSYLPKVLKPMVSQGVKWVENYAAPKMSGLVSAWPKIEERFSKIHDQVIGIYNFPEVDFLARPEQAVEKTRDICFVGLINEVRGLRQMLDMLSHVDAQLTIVGYFHSADLEAEMRRHPNWSKVEFMGFQNREKVAEILQSSRVGMATFLPDPNYLFAYPNKIFEYMAAELPVVSSNFPFWLEIVEGSQCGIGVDPQDVAAIAKAVQQILDAPEEAKAMGKRGREAVERQYNWLAQEKKLVQFYQDLLA